MQYRFNCHFSLWLTLGSRTITLLGASVSHKEYSGKPIRRLSADSRVHAELTTLRLDCHSYPIDWHLGGKMS